jgi:hypothetical protein
MVYAFHTELSEHAEHCDTDEKLREVLGAISTTGAYLSRMLQAAIVSHGNGGTIPPPDSPCSPHTPSVLLPQMTSTVLNAMEPEKAEQRMHLRHWVDLQHAASFASPMALATLDGASDA